DHGSAHRTHRFHPSQLDRLTSAERHAELPPLASLSAAGVVGGMTVIDLGCGPGFFAIPAAGIVGPRGHVYGVDVQAGMIEHLRTEIDRRQIPNISVLLSTESRVALPDETADIVFIAVVLHEVEDPVAFLGEAGRLVKRDGTIAIIEFHKRDDLVDGPSCVGGRSNRIGHRGGIDGQIDRRSHRSPLSGETVPRDPMT
ncbi:MAG: class I SAM-dependent methyltransferase, partial [Chloroflexi bacterium]|nr:class I SAM-dependent methyltransferase [Chloroflexota bacterium]